MNRTANTTLGMMIGFVLIAGVTGCTTTRSNINGMAPSFHFEKLARSEYEILGTVEGRGEVGSVFCFSNGDSQFGYVSYGATSAIGLGQLVLSNDAVAAATYNALSQVPDADIILPLRTTTSVSGIPCFRSETATVRGKAIRIKSARSAF